LIRHMSPIERGELLLARGQFDRAARGIRERRDRSRARPASAAERSIRRLECAPIDADRSARRRECGLRGNRRQSNR
jgi:hypothetical protein